MSGETVEIGKTKSILLLPPGVYPTVTPLKNIPTNNNTNNRNNNKETDSSNNNINNRTLLQMERFDKHRRLRRAMEAKETTLHQLTQLIIDNSIIKSKLDHSNTRHLNIIEGKEDKLNDKKEVSPMKYNSTNITSSSSGISPNLDLNNSKVSPIQNEIHNVTPSTHSPTIINHNTKEKERLEILVYDLRRELEAAGNALRNQTGAIKLITQNINLERKEPHRMIRSQRETQMRSSITLEDNSYNNNKKEEEEIEKEEIENNNNNNNNLKIAEERIKKLEKLLADEKENRKRVEKSYTELQTSQDKIKLDKTCIDINNKDENKELKNSLSSQSDEIYEVQKRALERRVRSLKEKENNLMQVIKNLEEMYRTSRHNWCKQEKEYKRYIQILESTLTRIERSLPPENLNRAQLFNMTLKLKSCEKLFNRRNNGVGFIDPYVIIYNPNGEKLLETIPQDDTDSPEFNQFDDFVTLKVARDSIWNITFDVYSRGANNARLFLGQAKIAINKLLEEITQIGCETQHKIKLQPRDRETDEEIIKAADKLGNITFSVIISVAGNIIPNSRFRNRISLTKRLISPKKDEELINENNEINSLQNNNNNNNNNNETEEKLPLSSSNCNKLIKPFESSEIIYEESSKKRDDILIKSFSIQVSVEACKGLYNQEGKGKIFVRIIEPNSNIKLTSLIPYTVNPSWNKEESSTVMNLHPLDSGVIEFHVININDESELKEEKLLGYAQFSIIDIFRDGFGKKELQLSFQPQKRDLQISQNVINLGSIIVSFTLLTSKPEKHDNNENNKKISNDMIGDVTKSIDSINNSIITTEQKEENNKEKNPSSVCIRIYVKEGHNLLDCDQEMFNALGVTDPRVMIWIGPDHVFTVPEKRETINPKWTTEEGEFIACVQSNQIIRFEVQDVDVTGFDSMGCASIHASEIISSPGERTLPVMLHGKQYGDLSVVFTVTSKDFINS